MGDTIFSGWLAQRASLSDTVMRDQMTDGYAALTEKEKQTLRLILRGHDAKSTARHLGLSVHTINERLRDARRKLAVSSSREAARLLLERERSVPDFVTDKEIGGAWHDEAVEQQLSPENGGGAKRPALVISGVALVSLILALAALVSQPQAIQTPADSSPSATARAAEAEASARRFLALLDQGKWDESYALTTASFQKLNTGKVWAQVSEQARPPLGALISRTMISSDDVPAPPRGYQVVKFRTTFASKANAIEKVSLEREGNDWRVAGVWIE